MSRDRPRNDRRDEPPDDRTPAERLLADVNANRGPRGLRALTEYEFQSRGHFERVYQNSLDPSEREAAVAEIRRIDGIPTTGWNTAIPSEIRAQVENQR